MKNTPLEAKSHIYRTESLHPFCLVNHGGLLTMELDFFLQHW